MPEVYPLQFESLSSGRVESKGLYREIGVLLTDNRAGFNKLSDLDGSTELHVLAPESILGVMKSSDSRYKPWAAKNSGEANWCLSYLGAPKEMIVSIEESVSVRTEYFLRVFLHLQPQGVVRIPRDSFASQTDFDQFATLLLETKISQLNRSANALIPPRLATLAEFFGDISVTAAEIIVQKMGEHLLKIRDVDATRLLKTRNYTQQIDDVQVIPGYEWKPAHTTRHIGVNFQPPLFADSFKVPALYLRVVEGARLVERCLTIQGNVALPSSFRFHLESNLNSPKLRSLSKDFSVLHTDSNFGWEYLEGDYYDLDCSNPGHFGHLTTEVISRLWGWEKAKEEFPNLKVLFRIRRPAERDPALERTLFTAYGIAEQDIVWVSGPVIVDRLVTATPEWQNQVPHYAAQNFTETWKRIKQGLGDASVRSPSKIFVSRRNVTANRSCRNTAQLEKLFEQNGFEVIYPEDYSLAQQSKIFGNAEFVAGFAGSALFNLMFATDKLKKLVVLTHEAYTARNEHLYSSLIGVETTYFWSRPEISHPEGGWSEEAYFSNWSFDMENLGNDLQRVLASN